MTSFGISIFIISHRTIPAKSFPFVFLFAVAFQSLLWYGGSEKAEKGRDTHGKTKADEFQWAVFALNSVRNTYLSAGRSSGGFDRILLKLLNSKYKYVPTR